MGSEAATQLLFASGYDSDKKCWCLFYQIYTWDIKAALSFDFELRVTLICRSYIWLRLDMRTTDRINNKVIYNLQRGNEYSFILIFLFRGFYPLLNSETVHTISVNTRRFVWHGHDVHKIWLFLIFLSQFWKSIFLINSLGCGGYFRLLILIGYVCRPKSLTNIKRKLRYPLF